MPRRLFRLPPVRFTCSGICLMAVVWGPILHTWADPMPAPTGTPIPDSAPLPVRIAATYPALHYSGRFKGDEATAGRSCEWPASAVTLRFEGTDLNVRLSDSKGQDFWQVVVDGQPTGKLPLRPGAHTYSVAAGLPRGPHTARLIKCTEATFGITQVDGFELNAGAQTLPDTPPRRRLEVIGDSISCGYGNEAANQHEHLRSDNENAWLAYGAVAARLLDTDYTCIAWSGKKLWPNNSVVDLYACTLPTERRDDWDFKQTPPADAVVIALGTNDLNPKSLPDEAGWIDAYKSFIARIRQNYPGVPVYCANSPMLGGSGPDGKHTILRDWLTKLVGDLTAAGDRKVFVVDFPTQDAKNGVGADWHPGTKTHELMAQQLAGQIRKDLGW